MSDCFSLITICGLLVTVCRRMGRLSIDSNRQLLVSSVQAMYQKGVPIKDEIVLIKHL